jgi:hypothetical protein
MEGFMSLQDKLDTFKKEFETGAPPEALAVIHRSTDDLLNSGIMAHVQKIGGRAPEFTLPNQEGQMVSSAELLGKGPLVLSFYRGIW